MVGSKLCILLAISRRLNSSVVLANLYYICKENKKSYTFACREGMIWIQVALCCYPATENTEVHTIIKNNKILIVANTLIFVNLKYQRVRRVFSLFLWRRRLMFLWLVCFLCHCYYSIQIGNKHVFYENLSFDFLHTT